MRLTAAGCARLWRSARDKRPEPHEGRWRCMGCPIGATNAGEEQAPLALAGEEWRNVCTRCLNRSDRLIHRRFCISCYNRDREARIGRNGKGGQPKLTDRLKPVSVAVATLDGSTTIMTEESATGAVEIMVWAAKTATGRLAFGPAPGSPAAEAYSNGYYDQLASLMDRANAGDGAAAEVLRRFFAAGEGESENDDAPNQPPQSPDDAPRGKDADARQSRERRPARRATFRDHLLASSRNTWPALAHSRARCVAP